jgi:hypothetical protein
MKGKDAGPSRELFEAVGALIMTASAVDQQVAFQILRFISPVDVVFFHAWPVVAGMDFRVKLTLIRTLASRHGKEVRDWIVECCDKMQALYQRRNQIAHSVFTGVSRGGRARFVTFNADSQTGSPRRPLVVTPKQIHEWAQELFVWGNELE